MGWRAAARADAVHRAQHGRDDRSDRPAHDLRDPARVADAAVRGGRQSCARRWRDRHPVGGRADRGGVAGHAVSVPDPRRAGRRRHRRRAVRGRTSGLDRGVGPAEPDAQAPAPAAPSRRDHARRRQRPRGLGDDAAGSDADRCHRAGQPRPAQGARSAGADRPDLRAPAQRHRAVRRRGLRPAVRGRPRRADPAARARHRGHRSRRGDGPRHRPHVRGDRRAGQAAARRDRARRSRAGARAEPAATAPPPSRPRAARA